MSIKKFEFEYTILTTIDELSPADQSLLQQARTVTQYAYAPYSNFRVGAAALLQSNEVITGTNQENASYPITICAERVLLVNAATQFPNMPIHTLAISYYAPDKANNNHPISPCGMCRQALLEYEERVKAPIRILLSGQHGEIVIIQSAKNLLPLAFSGDDLSS